MRACRPRVSEATVVRALSDASGPWAKLIRTVVEVDVAGVEARTFLWWAVASSAIARAAERRAVALPLGFVACDHLDVEEILRTLTRTVEDLRYIDPEGAFRAIGYWAFDESTMPLVARVADWLGEHRP